MSCQCGCGRLIHRGGFFGPSFPEIVEEMVALLPKVRVEGKPHLVVVGGRWMVGSDDFCEPIEVVCAHDHAAALNTDRITGITSYHLGREMFSFVDDSPPQLMTWTDDMPNDPTKWG
jgi:hypothetical protein